MLEDNESEQMKEISHWEELDKNNSVVKKYIINVSKNLVPIIDKMTPDERNTYINDAIQKKIDLTDQKKQRNKKIKLCAHFIIIVLTFIFLTPFALIAVNKAFMATFDNYKYSQDNFERLYKQRFEKDKAFMRLLQYNKEQEKKKASQAEENTKKKKK